MPSKLDVEEGSWWVDSASASKEEEEEKEKEKECSGSSDGNPSGIEPSAGGDLVEHVHWHDEEDADNAGTQSNLFDATLSITPALELVALRRTAEVLEIQRAEEKKARARNDCLYVKVVWSDRETTT